jgi:putative membrane protein
MKIKRPLCIVGGNAGILAAGLLLGLHASSIWAQQAGPQGYAYGGHMMWGGGWFGMLWGLLSMFLLLVAVIGGFALVARWFGTPRHDGHQVQHPPSGRAPLDILKERYARGEINKEEYEERRRVLSE